MPLSRVLLRKPARGDVRERGVCVAGHHPIYCIAHGTTGTPAPQCQTTLCASGHRPPLPLRTLSARREQSARVATPVHLCEHSPLAADHLWALRGGAGESVYEASSRRGACPGTYCPPAVWTLRVKKARRVACASGKAWLESR